MKYKIKIAKYQIPWGPIKKGLLLPNQGQPYGTLSSIPNVDSLANKVVTPKTTKEKIADELSDTGTRILKGVQTFGGSLIGDIIHDISPQAGDVVEKYSLGMIPYTRQEEFQANRTGNWNSRMGSAAMAGVVGLGGQALGIGMDWAAPKIANSIITSPTEKAINNLTDPTKLIKLKQLAKSQQGDIPLSDLQSKFARYKYDRNLKTLDSQEKLFNQASEKTRNEMYNTTKITGITDQNLINNYLIDNNRMQKMFDRKRVIHKTNYEQNIADRLNLPIDLKARYGEGNFGAVFGVKKQPNLVVKLGKPLDFETSQSMYELSQVEKELPNVRASFPIKTAFFSTENKKLMSQVMPKMKGRSGIPSEPVPQTAIDEVIGFAKQLKDKGIHLDYYNPDNFLYDKASQKFSLVDLNTTPPEGGFWNSVNSIGDDISQVISERFSPNIAAQQAKINAFLLKGNKPMSTPSSINFSPKSAGGLDMEAFRKMMMDSPITTRVPKIISKFNPNKLWNT